MGITRYLAQKMKEFAGRHLKLDKSTCQSKRVITLSKLDKSTC
jgi:hypothetical protein